eukprot:7510179-Pyramimonas_sp.AAC.1
MAPVVVADLLHPTGEELSYPVTITTATQQQQHNNNTTIIVMITAPVVVPKIPRSAYAVQRVLRCSER